MPNVGQRYYVDFGDGHFNGVFEHWFGSEEGRPHDYLVFDTGEISLEAADIYELIDDGMELTGEEIPAR